MHAREALLSCGVPKVYFMDTKQVSHRLRPHLVNHQRLSPTLTFFPACSPSSSTSLRNKVSAKVDSYVLKHDRSLDGSLVRAEGFYYLPRLKLVHHKALHEFRFADGRVTEENDLRNRAQLSSRLRARQQSTTKRTFTSGSSRPSSGTRAASLASAIASGFSVIAEL